jgi:hypothetical protein
LRSRERRESIVDRPGRGFRCEGVEIGCEVLLWLLAPLRDCATDA